MFSISEHSRIISALWKTYTGGGYVSYSKITLLLRSNLVMLKNNTEHTELLFITLTATRPGFKAI